MNQPAPQQVVTQTIKLTLKQMYELKEGRSVNIVTGGNIMGDDLVTEIKPPRQRKV